MSVLSYVVLQPCWIIVYKSTAIEILTQVLGSCSLNQKSIRGYYISCTVCLSIKLTTSNNQIPQNGSYTKLTVLEENSRWSLGCSNNCFGFLVSSFEKVTFTTELRLRNGGHHGNELMAETGREMTATTKRVQQCRWCHEKRFGEVSVAEKPHG